MDLKRIYHNSDGNECNILQLVKSEPEWAANVIQHSEKQIKKLEEMLKTLDILSQ